MPLKIVSRAGTEALYVRGTVRGQSVFESTGTADPGQAEAYRVKREAELWQRSVYGARATVTFATAVAAYLEAEERSPTTKTHLTRLLKHFRVTPLDQIGQEQLDAAYKVILTDGIRATPATKIRAVLTPLRAVLEFAAIRRWCDRPAFDTPKLPRPKTAFLRPDEASALVEQAAEHLRPLLVFLIGTGVRMSEALELEWSRVDLRGAQATVWQKQDNERIVDLPPVVIAALSALPHRDGRVFRPVRSRRPAGATKGKTIGDGYMDTGRTGGGQIKKGWAFACHRAGLPGHWRIWTPVGGKRELRQWVPDATPHSLRHTWATWHYCLHRDLIRLKDDGGWSTITMVTRYAKRLPDTYRPDVEAWLNGTVRRAKSVQSA